jgi:predicted nucleic acid-binding protein
LTTYADSSFFVSLYLIDLHSKEAWHRMTLGSAVWLTPLNRAEVAHALYLQMFWKKATLLEAEKALFLFDRDSAAGVWQNVSFPPGAFARSIDLTRQYGATIGVRTLDSLHVACALELKATRFWTFDDRQARLAEAGGLDTKA